MLDFITPEKKNELLLTLRDISKECSLSAIAVVSSEGQEVAFFAEKDLKGLLFF